ncbi:unnamed protein product [Arctogadus glacialis]
MPPPPPTGGLDASASSLADGCPSPGEAACVACHLRYPSPRQRRRLPSAHHTDGSAGESQSASERPEEKRRSGQRGRSEDRTSACEGTTPSERSRLPSVCELTRQSSTDPSPGQTPQARPPSEYRQHHSEALNPAGEPSPTQREHPEPQRHLPTLLPPSRLRLLTAMTSEGLTPPVTDQPPRPEPEDIVCSVPEAYSLESVCY